jgi:translation initiation factor IF-2
LWNFSGRRVMMYNPNPNTKVSDEQYQLLLKEFSSEINLKKESEKISFRIAREIRDQFSIEKESKKGKRRSRDR